MASIEPALLYRETTHRRRTFLISQFDFSDIEQRWWGLDQFYKYSQARLKILLGGSCLRRVFSLIVLSLVPPPAPFEHPAGATFERDGLTP